MYCKINNNTIGKNSHVLHALNCPCPLYNIDINPVGNPEALTKLPGASIINANPKASNNR